MLQESQVALRFPEHARLPSVPFASCYIYSPRGTGLISEGSRLLCERVKRSDPVWLARYAGSVLELAERHGHFRGVFAGAPVLVPIPGSDPSDGGPWAAAHLAAALRELGLARATWLALRRQFAVRKSSRAPAGRRPTVQEHYQSLLVGARVLKTPEKIILIDADPDAWTSAASRSAGRSLRRRCVLGGRGCEAGAVIRPSLVRLQPGEANGFRKVCYGPSAGL
jgi:hypothetical protein